MRVPFVEAVARLPTRLRLALAFTGAAALVLVALGVFLHGRLGSQLDAAIERGLRQRAGELAAIGDRGATGLERGALIERGDDLAQVLDARGRVVAGARGFDRTPLLTAREVGRARRAAVWLRRRPMPGDDEAMTLLAIPIGGRVIVVGASLESRDDAMASLDGLLVVGLPAALLIAGLAGFVVAGRALRPVEAMRARAETIQAARLSQRLPVPAADDELRRLAETLNAMLDRLERGFARERAFVAEAGNELQAPIARLHAELERALGPGHDAGEIRAALASAEAEGQHLKRLSEDLLVIARSDEGRLQVRREPLELGALLAAVRRRFLPAAEGRELRVRLGEGPLSVQGDRLRLEQAVGYLVDNALRHGAGVVTLEATSADAAVEIHVRDEGSGLPAGFEARAFERFSRGDPARGGGGAGLGLAIVAAIAAAHDGVAGGAGADLWIRIPVRATGGSARAAAA